jgi:hypothetical protein
MVLPFGKMELFFTLGLRVLSVYGGREYFEDSQPCLERHTCLEGQKILVFYIVVGSEMAFKKTYLCKPKSQNQIYNKLCVCLFVSLLQVNIKGNKLTLDMEC